MQRTSRNHVYCLILNNNMGLQVSEPIYIYVLSKIREFKNSTFSSYNKYFPLLLKWIFWIFLNLNEFTSHSKVREKWNSLHEHGWTFQWRVQVHRSQGDDVQRLHQVHQSSRDLTGTSPVNANQHSTNIQHVQCKVWFIYLFVQIIQTLTDIPGVALCRVEQLWRESKVLMWCCWRLGQPLGVSGLLTEL